MKTLKALIIILIYTGVCALLAIAGHFLGEKFWYITGCISIGVLFLIIRKEI